jgi:hypothetical protein
MSGTTMGCAAGAEELELDADSSDEHFSDEHEEEPSFGKSATGGKPP